jgi:hypothetical protein
MKCLNCKKILTSGILMFVPGDSYTSFGIDTETYKYVPIERHEVKRIIAFCNKKCREELLFNKRGLNKLETPFNKRLITREQVIAEFQKVLIESDDEERKDLVYVLGKSIWR